MEHQVERQDRVVKISEAREAVSHDDKGKENPLQSWATAVLHRLPINKIFAFY